MNRNQFVPVAALTFALICAFTAPRRVGGQDNKTPYPNMASLDQYLMDRGPEIALARSAAPPSIAKDATVMVLGKHGYETAVEGTNGFVCMVDRTWTDGFDRPEFWNPKNRGPACYNPQAARSVLPIDLMRTKFALAGQSKEEIHESMKAAIAKGELPALEPGAMIYMLSKQGRINDSAGHWHPHLMFYVPLGDAKTWGAGEPGSPIYVAPRFNGAPEPVTELIIVVSEWSDGTADR
ncbi:MAG TPA: hypothetical protein VFV92_02805 [Candidatus Bathyarchaeia archaeon]|nr:hypothetical protein [Candidatus Bathyarchaeia archaeon]